MSLTTRLLLFLQGALAAVLITFCIALYILADWYLSRRATESVDRAAATLVASVDIEPDSVDWEPSDREVSVGNGPLGGTLVWLVMDGQGNLIDRSAASETTEFVGAVTSADSGDAGLDDWLITRRTVHPPGATGDALTRARTAEETEKGEYPAVFFTVGLRAGPIRTAMRELTFGLAGVAIAIWLTSLFIGRSFCRSALSPVTAMAHAATQLNADDLESTLQPAGAEGELADLQRAMSGLLDRFHDSIRRERRFTAEASHQLRTPLATILGQIEVLLRRPRSSEEYDRVLRILYRQASQMSRTVESLLFLARTEADAETPSLESIDLVAWTEEFIDSMADDPRRCRIKFDREDTSSHVVNAHPALLRELVVNLVDNALKYSPEAEAVKVDVLRKGQDVVLAVEDRGPGIAATDLPHVFEPFYRTADAQKQGFAGAGLGLTVTRRIAAAFGAQVQALSAPQGGSRFEVRFPVADSSPNSKEAFIFDSRST